MKSQGMADTILDLTVSRDRAPERPNGHECARQDAELREQTTAYPMHPSLFTNCAVQVEHESSSAGDRTMSRRYIVV